MRKKNFQWSDPCQWPSCGASQEKANPELDGSFSLPSRSPLAPMQHPATSPSTVFMQAPPTPTATSTLTLHQLTHTGYYVTNAAPIFMTNIPFIAGFATGTELLLLPKGKRLLQESESTCHPNRGGLRVRTVPCLILRQQEVMLNSIKN
jgi:hypothetical protein